MSTRKGSGDTRNRKPAHQNTFAFRHNPKSRKTAKILASPNVGLCPSCHDKIEWRKKYRKYKPLRQPATCNGCHKKTVTAAYHKLCTACAKERRVCPFCCTGGRRRAGGEDEEDDEEFSMDGGTEGEGGGGRTGRGGAKGRGEAPMVLSDGELEEDGMWELDEMHDVDQFESGSRRSGEEERKKR